MIECSLKYPKAYFNFTTFVDRSDFEEILELCHIHNLSFDKETKAYSGSYMQSYGFINDLRSSKFDVEISDIYFEKLKPSLKLKFKRRSFDQNLFKSTPLGDYQIEDTKKMIYAQGIINGSDVGLGKTIETITALNHLFKDNEIDKVLIVTFAQATYNWKRELLKFSTFCKSEDIVIPNLKNRNPFDSNAKVIVCSYNMFVLMDKYFYGLSHKNKLTKKTRTNSIPFENWGKSIGIVLDEAHSIKSESALRTKCIMRYKDYFTYKYLLSATPYPNGPEELYCLLNFLDENIIYSTYNRFIRKIACVGTKFNKNAIQIDFKTRKKRYKIEPLNEFLKTIDPYIFRRFGEKKTNQYIKNIYVEMNSKQRLIYETIISDRLERIKEENGFVKVYDVVNNFPYLTLACSDPSILKNKLTSKDPNIFSDKYRDKIETMLNEWKFEFNSKLDVCNDIINENSKEKIIIWSTHPNTIELLSNYYGDKKVLSIHGNSHVKSGLEKEEYRENLLQKFKKSKDCNLIVMNPSVMGTALNIEESTISIFFDRNYDIKEYLQALGRNYRGISKRDVMVYVLMNDKTLENIQDSILNNKDNINKYLLKYDSLPLDEWRKIFNGEA